MVVELGDKVQDTVSKLIGFAVSKTVYLNGCVQIEIIRPVNEKGELDTDTIHIDEAQLKVLKKSKLILPFPDRIPEVIVLGDEVEDELTGVKGIATARTYSMGNVRDIEIERPVDENGKPRDAISVRECLLNRVGYGVNKPPRKKPKKKEPAGGVRKHRPSSYNRT